MIDPEYPHNDPMDERDRVWAVIGCVLIVVIVIAVVIFLVWGLWRVL